MALRCTASGSGTSRGHAARRLDVVVVTAYNDDFRTARGYVGDRGSIRAFRAVLDRVRATLRRRGADPLGNRSTAAFAKKQLDALLAKGDPEAGGAVLAAVDAFAGELAQITARLLRFPAWRGVRRVVVGGGFRASRIGELAIGCASLRLKEMGHRVALTPIRHHPDDAGLIGAVHLTARERLAGYDAVLAVDIGGSNVRAGLVELHATEAADFARSVVRQRTVWRYADEAVRPTREEVLRRLGRMLKRLAHKAEAHLRLAPFIGVACPGEITEAGMIARGGLNLPGNWELASFNLAERIAALLPTVAGRDTAVVVHNDAVVQGLSQLPFMRDVSRWGVLTIGTGLGNAAFRNLSDAALEGHRPRRPVA